MTQEIRLFLSGDSILQHTLATDANPARVELAEIARSCDLALSNLECNIQVGEDWPAYVAGQGRGTTYMAAPPEVLDDLKWFGIRAVFTANNHSSDFGEGGILTTIGYLDAAGLGHAGTGASLTDATSGCVVDGDGTKFAVIGASDWGPRGLTDLTFPWPMGVLAADGDERFAPRPGVNLLRYEGIIHADEKAVSELRRISTALGWDRAKQIRDHGGGRSEPLYSTSVFDREVDDEQAFHFMGRRFEVADEFSFETVAFQEDLDRNCAAVERARDNADFVIVGVHQQGASRIESRPPDHTVAFAHAVIDAGADLFVAHGRARAGGVEIYNGKPILYGVPGFINHLDKVPFVPVEQKRRWGLSENAPASKFIERRQEAESQGRTAIGVGANGFLPMVALTVEISDNSGKIRFHPFELVDRGSEVELGEPRLLHEGPLATETLEIVQERVRALGTDFSIEGATGLVEFAG